MLNSRSFVSITFALILFLFCLLFISPSSAHQKKIPCNPPSAHHTKIPSTPPSAYHTKIPSTPPSAYHTKIPSTPPSAHHTKIPSTPSTHQTQNFKNCFSKIFAFGDSFTDTGNAKAVGDLVSFGKALISGSPYGSTFFNGPANRFCDGRLVVDFLCETLGLPHVPAYKNSSADFTHGCNFAVAGSTSLDSDYFVKNKVSRTLKWKEVPVSIQTQVDWFNEYLKQVECKGKDANACKSQMENALCWIGEMGGSDYTRNFGSKIKVETLTQMSVDRVCKLLKTLLDAGAKYVVVQGLPPSGCFPLEMSLAPQFDHDEIGCAGSTNSIIKLHNNLLRKKVDEMRQQHPDCMIVFADFWGAYQTIMENPIQYGFQESFKACCGSGTGPFNFNLNAVCGSSKATKCEDPTKHINWDGLHLTEAMNQKVSELFFTGGFCKPSFSELLSAKKSTMKTGWVSG